MPTELRTDRDDFPADGEDICGETYDHDAEVTHVSEDGVTYWRCRRCDAEGWDVPEAPHAD